DQIENEFCSDSNSESTSKDEMIGIIVSERGNYIEQKNNLPHPEVYPLLHSLSINSESKMD
ncbi:MAG: hypothetical protein ACK53Y_18440, partial [bacterium]